MQNAVMETIMENKDIRSGSTGAEVIYYGDPLPYVFAARILLIFAEVYSLFASTGTSTIRVFAQYSVDGEIWNNFTADLLSATSTGTKTGTENTTTAEFGPLVRVNVAISNASSSQASARVTVKLRSLFWS
jgi:hypothetical protein